MERELRRASSTASAAPTEIDTEVDTEEDAAEEKEEKEEEEEDQMLHDAGDGMGALVGGRYFELSATSSSDLMPASSSSAEVRYVYGTAPIDPTKRRRLYDGIDVTAVLPGLVVTLKIKKTTFYVLHYI